jgi:hypothetical protein
MNCNHDKEVYSTVKPKKLRHPHARVRRRLAPLVVIMLITLSGCAQVNKAHVWLTGKALSPEQARTQVVDAARDIVAVTGIDVRQAWAYVTACEDLVDATYRTEVVAHFPLASGRQESLDDIAAYLAQLEERGWAVLHERGFPDTMARKDGLLVWFHVQGGFQVRGECRDITTTRDTRPQSEPVDLRAPR